MLKTCDLATVLQCGPEKILHPLWYIIPVSGVSHGFSRYFHSDLRAFVTIRRFDRTLAMITESSAGGSRREKNLI
jgi:hypothetical protein